MEFCLEFCANKAYVGLPWIDFSHTSLTGNSMFPLEVSTRLNIVCCLVCLKGQYWAQCCLTFTHLPLALFSEDMG